MPKTLGQLPSIATVRIENLHIFGHLFHHVCLASYMLNNPYPKALLWGQEYVLIYNAAYAAMCGKKHPGMFGQTGPVAWQELWEM